MGRFLHPFKNPSKEARDLQFQKLVFPFYIFRKHKDDAPANDDEENDQDRKKQQEVPKWDAEFLKVDQGTLFGKIKPGG